MKTVAEILTEQGAQFDTKERENGNIAYFPYTWYTEVFNGVPVRRYKRYDKSAIITDKSGKIIGFEEMENAG